MQFITSLILACFVGYAGSWYLGMHDGNFALLLFMAVVVTGCYWLAERFYFLPQREKAAQALQDASTARMAELTKMGISRVDGDLANITSCAREDYVLSHGGWTGRQVCFPLFWSYSCCVRFYLNLSKFHQAR